MPTVEGSKRDERTVSFAPNLIDPREEEEIIRQAQEAQLELEQDNGAGLGPSGTETLTAAPRQNTYRYPDSPQSTDELEIDDGTGRRFKIPFQEHRLRFDQTFPEGLEMRIPENEFGIVLEQIHRDLIKPLDKGQKSVKKWSYATAGTAPIGVGFVLSIFLARRVNRHQKSLKNFWLSLRSHLKALNRDIYYARGIEWRIERDMEKVSDRDAYNKMHSFRIEIIFRKPIVLRSGREAALHSITEQLPSRISNSSRFSDSHLADPALFALLSTGPNGENYTFPTDLGEDEGDNLIVPETIQEEEGSPLIVTEHPDDDESIEPLFITVPEPAEVTEARVSSALEPPSPLPSASIFSSEQTHEDSAGVGTTETTKIKMTFADMLRSSLLEEQRGDDVNSSDGSNNIGTLGTATVVGMTAAMAASTLTRSPSPPPPPPPPPTTTTTNSNEPSTPVLTTADTKSPQSTPRESREEAFAQRQRKKFSRNSTLVTQLYAIPESPTLPLKDADPAGDAMNFLNAPEGLEEDLLEDFVGGVGVNSRQFDFESIKPVVTNHFEDIGDTPVAAYPMADPFAALYETDETVPLDPPTDSESESELQSGFTEFTEFIEVDGETEFVRRKKWRVAPERADKLARVQTMTESIHPGSRKNSYLPVTKSVLLPDTIDFKATEDVNVNIVNNK